MIFEAGASVGGRYVVERELAAGGMGRVYAVTRSEDGERFALKTIKKKAVNGERTLERFRREAQMLGSLEHPGVVEMIDSGMTPDGGAYLVMELLEGETLLEYLEREAPVRAAALKPVVDGIAAALDAVHSQGVVHRDLKPSNVFLTDTGVKLVDFGVAHATNLERMTQSGEILGTVRYMSAEQLQGERIDHRSDVYSLGIIIWSALAGGPPHGGPLLSASVSILRGTPRIDEHVGDVSRKLADVLAKATALHPEDRYASAGEVAAAFSQHADGAPTERLRAVTGFVPITMPQPVASIPAEPIASNRSPLKSTVPAKPIQSERPPPTRDGGEALPKRDGGEALPKRDGGEALPKRSSGSVRPPGPIRRFGRRRTAAVGTVAFIMGAGCALAVAMLMTDEAASPPAADASHLVPAQAPPVEPVAPPIPETPETRYVTIEAEPVATVTADGEDLGPTPTEVAIPVGDAVVSVELAADGFRSKSIEVNSESPEEIAIELEAVRRPSKRARRRPVAARAIVRPASGAQAEVLDPNAGSTSQGAPEPDPPLASPMRIRVVDTQGREVPPPAMRLSF